MANSSVTPLLSPAPSFATDLAQFEEDPRLAAAAEIVGTGLVNQLPHNLGSQ